MRPSDENRPRRHILWIGVGVILLATAVTLLVVRERASRGPRVLNEPTKAREVRPFSDKPDPRFAPLPLEREKHGK